jgi:hypothetical protein
MEKYGVNQTKDKSVKQATSEKTCPVCGSTLVVHGSVLLCRTHGSAPFEGTNTEED